MLRFVFFTLKTYVRANNPGQITPRSDCSAAVEM